MKKATNSVQEDYLLARANLETVKALQEEIEHQYIADNKITNPDGSVPSWLFCIDDDATAERAIKECSVLIIDAGLENELNTARNFLKEAEDKLVEYGLSLAPAETQAILKRAVKTNTRVRNKVIDLALRLDASTVDSTKASKTGQLLGRWQNHKFSSSPTPEMDYILFQKDAIAALRELCTASGFMLNAIHKSRYDFCAVAQSESTSAFFFISIPDMRFYQSEWATHVLYRTMRHENDLVGGNNHYCRFDELGKCLTALDIELSSCSSDGE